MTKKQKKRLKRIRAIERELAGHEGKLADLKELKGRAENAMRLPSFLSKEEGRWLAEQLALVCQEAVRTAATERSGVKVGTVSMKRVAESIGGRFGHLPSDDLKAIYDYAQLSLAQWAHEASQHLSNVERMARIVPPDEMHLLMSQAMEADDRGGAMAKAETWYSGVGDGECEAAKVIAGDLYDALSAVGFDAVAMVLKKHYPKQSTQPGRAAVRHYLRIVQQTYEGATEAEATRALDGSDPQDGQRLARLLWAAMRNARVFEISDETHSALHLEVTEHVTSKVAKIPEGKGIDTLDRKEGQAVLDRLWDAAARLPLFDDIMPFDHIFVGIGGEGQPMDRATASMMLSEAPTRMIRCRLLGYLIGPVWGSKPSAVLFLRVTAPGGEDYVVPCAEFLSKDDQRGAWMNPTTMTPWMVNSILTFIHEHKTVVLEQKPTFAMRKDYSRLSKKTGGLAIIPKPYYLVPLRDKVIKEGARRAVGSMGRRAPLTYRHDRRGHERCRVQRGPLPLDPKRAAKLEERGYKIWTVEGPDAEGNRQLLERRLPPKRADEWLAILTSWIDHKVIGSSDLPYVPAVRVSKRDLG
jgi:hypothetical protein